jgi:REP element-mobilizing transposase RayT
MKDERKERRRDAAFTGRRDACPTTKTHLIAGFHSRDHLPHLKKEGACYFMTFRLAGTLPKEVVLRFKQEREQLLKGAAGAKRPLTWQEQSDLFDWYSTRVDAHLDAGEGECYLRRAEVAQIVLDALKFFDGERYDLVAWVSMPNHVHVVVRPNSSETLSDILHSWKSFTAKKANEFLGREGQAFWQGESYDHLIRDDEDRAWCVAYTLNNPVKARLCARPEDWMWSSACRAGVPPASETGILPVGSFERGKTGKA